MKTYLLLWNPKRWDWRGEASEVFRHLERGDVVHWICGTNRSIVPGDTVFLMRTDHEPRGIFASGTARARPSEAIEWDERLAAKGRTAYFVQCVFDSVRDSRSDSVLGFDALRGVAPEFFSGGAIESGMLLPEKVAAAVASLWDQSSGSKRRPIVTAEPGAIEGMRTEVVAYVRGRSRRLRDAALHSSNGVCECCGVNYSEVLGGLGVRVLQVHHRKQLASTEAPRLSSVEDLAVVCANCHALIHQNPKKALKVEELSKRLAADRST